MRRRPQKLGCISSGGGIFLRCNKKCTNRGDLCILRGADDGIRTRDLRLTKAVRYLLCHISLFDFAFSLSIIPILKVKVNRLRAKSKAFLHRRKFAKRRARAQALLTYCFAQEKDCKNRHVAPFYISFCVEKSLRRRKGARLLPYRFALKKVYKRE